jgi:N-acetylglucosamine kinase-like BadF-type ATPase
VSKAAIVGVDIGGTKTHLALASDGRTLAERVLPTREWRVREPALDARRLAALVRDLARGTDPVATVVGAHGCDTAAQCDLFRGHLHPLLEGAVEVVNDAELLVPAAGYGVGVGVVAGTGSIAVARRPDRTMLVAGGWGWLLGDEGSAPGLVREAARAVRAAIDAGEPSDPLAETLLRTLDAGDPTELGRHLEATRGAEVWGRHAHAVFAAAEAGSRLARRVVEDGGRALATLVTRLVGRGAPRGPVVAGGGVIANQPALMAAFAAELARVLPGTEAVLLREPPVTGAVVLAGRLLSGSGRTS